MVLLPFERVDMRINAKIIFKNLKRKFALHILTQTEGFTFQEDQHIVRLYIWLFLKGA